MEIVQLKLSHSLLVELRRVRDHQATWLVLEELHEKLLFCLSAQSLKDSLIICHAQQRQASSDEISLLGSSSSSSQQQLLHGLLVEVKAVCAIVRYLTNNQALASSLAQVPSLPAVETVQQTVPSPPPQLTGAKPSGETALLSASLQTCVKPYA